jgi:ribosomal protein S18 acetylase RimI-like enzyme
MTTEATIYRAVEPQDFTQLRALHDELFPVKYTDSFFRSVVEGRCVRGGLRLFSSMAIQNEEIVGFIVAQTMPIASCEDIHGLFDAGNEPLELCYILTLGLRRGLRRSGIGSILLTQCLEFASQIANCGAVLIASFSFPDLR